MKLSCLSENLAKGLSTVNRIATTTGSLPVLSHLLLATDEGRLRVAGTNLEIGISTAVGAKIEAEGAITVPANIISELISSLPPQKIELNVEKLSLSVNGEGVSAKLNGMPAEEFPELPATDGEPSLELDAEEVLAALRQVVFATATDEGRPVLTGVLFRFGTEELTLVGVDGFRLSEKKIKVETGGGGNWEGKEVVVPARAIKELIRTAEEKKIKIRVEAGEGRIIFESGDVTLSSRLLEGSFPDYQKIIPADTVVECTVTRDELQKGVRLAAIFARGSSSIIKLSLESDQKKIILSANTAEIGENTVEVGTEKMDGEDLQIAFNSAYLSDCLSNLNAKELNLKFAGTLKPLMVKPEGDDSFLHLVMPVRVQEE